MAGPGKTRRGVSAGSVAEKASAAKHLLPSWLFLEFLHALEQGVFNASEGSMGRPAAQAGALAFFAGNKKVRVKWETKKCVPCVIVRMPYEKAFWCVFVAVGIGQFTECRRVAADNRAGAVRVSQGTKPVPLK